MNLRFLESFVVTANLGSFSKAAESLCVTQAAVAARVAKLEEELGTVLFAREGSNLRLTDQGRKVLHHGRQLISQAQHFMQQVRAPEMTLGTLRMGWTGFMSQLLMPHLLQRLTQRYPRMNVEICTLSSLELMEALTEGRLDLVLSVGAHASRLWVEVPVCALEMCWLASPGLFAPSPPRSLEALFQVPIITYPIGTLPHQAMIQQIASTGVPAPPWYAMSTVAETLTLLEHGLGATVCPRLIAQPLIDAGKLVILDLPLPIATMNFYASYREFADYSLNAEVCAMVRSLLSASS